MRFPHGHFTSYSQALALQARDFLIAICEPKRRPEFLHEYSLDKNALFAAASMGMTADLEVAIAEGATVVRVGRALLEGLSDEARS